MKKQERKFEEEYGKLNPAQKEAVDQIEGPVMVIAGPGTGKTQILALRIANILTKTDVGPGAVLCLTFTNSAVEAMRERLLRYIGADGAQVNVFTFHSFGLQIIEKYFEVLGLQEAPKLLDEKESAEFFDAILQSEEWQYLRPRGEPARYFGDLKSLFSLLKRERLSSEEFGAAVRDEIERITASEDSLATRGKTKGELKQEAVKKIESLEKSREVARFLQKYETEKKTKNMLDYDDVLEHLVRIVENSPEALADIREQYLYVLVDEHQDSSRVQNEFLSKVWAPLEDPNIFVVGDDRQLIYGFAGASIDHFKSFQKKFKNAQLIPLVQNYRSTQIILDSAHALLPSVLTGAKLLSNRKENHPIQLITAGTPEEEIMAAGEAIGAKIAAGVNPSECALLVPKNADVHRALRILHDLGLPLALKENLNLFDQNEAQAFLRILKIIEGDIPALTRSFLDDFSGINPLEAHRFLAGQNMREFSLDSIYSGASLFESAPEKWLAQLRKWRKDGKENELPALISKIGREIAESGTKSRLVPIQDITATFLSLLEHRPNATLGQFIAYLDKLSLYGDPITLISQKTEGVRVLTLHGSKGLEFDFVWIAHLEEHSLLGGRRLGFAMPESIAEKIEERDADGAKRKLYVAITRARYFCTLSYATSSLKGREQELARIVRELPEEVFLKTTREAKIKLRDLSQFSEDVSKLAREKYSERYLSASLLNNFYECPRKWYFNNLLQMPEPPNENLNFGSAVHAALEQILKQNKLVLPEDIKVARIVGAWGKRRLGEISRQREAEYSISFKDPRFPNLKIYGRIDLLEKLPDGTVRVTDFKTGSARRKSEIEKLDEEGRMSNYLRQLAMYTYLLANNPKWQAEVSSARLEFVEEDGDKAALYDTFISEERLAALIRDIREYNEAVRSGGWLTRKCNFNSYGRNIECPYCELLETAENCIPRIEVVA